MKHTNELAQHSQTVRLLGCQSVIEHGRTALWVFNPLWKTFSDLSAILRTLALTPWHYNSKASHSFHPGFNLGLFPVHSPLLRKSLLFSFPALSNMLKFSALSCTAEVEVLKHEGINSKTIFSLKPRCVSLTHTGFSFSHVSAVQPNTHAIPVQHPPF